VPVPNLYDGAVHCSPEDDQQPSLAVTTHTAVWCRAAGRHGCNWEHHRAQLSPERCNFCTALE
jgi:hypothetical protein